MQFLRSEREEQKKAFLSHAEGNDAASQKPHEQHQSQQSQPQVQPSPQPVVNAPALDESSKGKEKVGDSLKSTMGEREWDSEGKGSGFMEMEIQELRKIRAAYMREMMDIEKQMDLLLMRKREVEEKWRATFPKKKKENKTEEQHEVKEEVEAEEEDSDGKQEDEFEAKDSKEAKEKEKEKEEPKELEDYKAEKEMEKEQKRDEENEELHESKLLKETKESIREAEVLNTKKEQEEEKEGKHYTPSQLQ